MQRETRTHRDRDRDRDTGREIRVKKQLNNWMAEMESEDFHRHRGSPDQGPRSCLPWVAGPAVRKSKHPDTSVVVTQQFSGFEKKNGKRSINLDFLWSVYQIWLWCFFKTFNTFGNFPIVRFILLIIIQIKSNNFNHLCWYIIFII